MYDIIIIGAGTAGLTAAIYAKRAGYSVLVLEKNTYGGQIINSSEIENYPALYKISGFDYATNLYNQVKSLDATILFEEVKDLKDGIIKEVITNKNTYKAKAIIIATGATNRRLNIDSEEKFIGKGISYCATCDGAFYKNKTVAVLGGGNTAFEDANYLANFCKKVYIIHRRDEFRADIEEINKAKNKNNIEFILNSNIVKINGEDKLTSINISSNNLEKELIIDGLFIAIGQVPENTIFKDLVSLDKNGYIISTDCTTNKDGIFVAGDNRTKELRQLITAASDGAIAANKAIKYIKLV